MAQIEEMQEAIDISTKEFVQRMRAFLAMFEAGQIEFEYLKTAQIDHELRMIHIGYKRVSGSIH